MLLDEKMLPGIKIRIPQMEDLLRRSRAYLGVILEVAEWLRERMILLNEEVMNIPNLKAQDKTDNRMGLRDTGGCGASDPDYPLLF
ncbi:MAG: hypothetical protein ACLRZZ_28530 [Enterocloster sp.]